LSVAPEMLSPGSLELKAMLSPGTGSPELSVTYAVTAAVEVPLAGIAGGEIEVMLMLAACPYCVSVALPGGISGADASEAVMVEWPGVVEDVIVDV
jgi:hypothetical protein